MVDDRRVTRSVSNDLQARALATQQSASYPGLRSTTPDVSSGYQHQQQQHSYGSAGQGQQQPSSRSMDVEHQLDQEQPQQQSADGMNGAVCMEGDSIYARNTSEELLRSFLNAAMVPGTPLMDVSSLEFLDSLQLEPTTPQTPRGNSEELFHSFISTNTENSNQDRNSGSTSTENGARQDSLSRGLQAILGQQNGAPWVLRTDNVEQSNVPTNPCQSEDVIAIDSSNVKTNQKPHRSILSKDKAKSIDHNRGSPLQNILKDENLPMTRSRSAELRRRQMDGLQVPPSADAIQKIATDGTPYSTMNPAMTSTGMFPQGIGKDGGLNDGPDSKPMGSQVLRSPLLSTSAPVKDKQQNQQQAPVEQYSNVVSDLACLLKGSLERKKFQEQQQQQNQQRQPQQQRARSRQHPMSPLKSNPQQDELLNRPQDHSQQVHSEVGLANLGQVQQNNLPHTQSPTASSGGALSHSAGIATSDGPTNSGLSPHRQALKRGNGDIYENGTATTDMPKKSDHLARAGSITSSLRQGFQLKEIDGVTKGFQLKEIDGATKGFQLKEIDGATKQRRVERQRKMAEAKGRGNAAPLPADLQVAMKRCDALEKEVRSLKLNLSFMNRKDSEQTKKIEELEHQNEDLKEQKDRLLESLERVSGKHNLELLGGKRMMVGTW